MLNFDYSFKQWCIDVDRIDILKRWDYKLNKCNPEDISFKSNGKYYFKCPEEKHKSRAFKICDLHKSKHPLLKCEECGSFANYIITNYGEDYFNKIWNDNNTINPWKIQFKSNKKGIFNCIKNSDHVYDLSFEKYSRGVRCPYCSHHRINANNSLASTNPEVLELWSAKNIRTPYEFAPHSSELIWWKCNNGIHEDYQRTITCSNSRKFICPECGKKQSSISKRENLSGMIFGDLTPICVNEERTCKEGRVFWDCRCSCGNVVSISVTNLKTGNSTTCGDRSIHYSKENNGNWKGGVTAPLQIERTSVRYNNWRNSVYKKDWYTCQCCGRNKNICKNAHHINNFLDYENLRYEISNGILLCDECHSFAQPNGFHHIYGTRNNTPEQLEEYINNRRKELNINKPFKMINYLNGDKLKPNMV